MANLALVVGNTGTPDTDDAAIKTLLEGAGHTVTYVADTSPPSPASTYDGYVTVPSTSGANVVANFGKSFAAPVVYLDQNTDVRDMFLEAGASVFTRAENDPDYFVFDSTPTDGYDNSGSSAAVASSGSFNAVYADPTSFDTGDAAGFLGEGSTSRVSGIYLASGGTFPDGSTVAPAHRAILMFTDYDGLTTHGENIVKGLAAWSAGAGGGSPASGSDKVRVSGAWVTGTDQTRVSGAWV